MLSELGFFKEPAKFWENTVCTVYGIEIKPHSTAVITSLVNSGVRSAKHIHGEDFRYVLCFNLSQQLIMQIDFVWFRNSLKCYLMDCHATLTLSFRLF